MARLTVASRELASYGKLIEPFVDSFYNAAGATSTGLVPAAVAPVTAGNPFASTAASLRRRVRLYRDNRESRVSRRSVETRISGFSMSVFETNAVDAFHRLHKAYSRGDLQSIRDMTTDQLFSAVRRAVEAETKVQGHTNGMKIVSIMEPPKVVQVRTGYLVPMAMRGWFEKPSHAQITLRVVSHQRMHDPDEGSKHARRGKKAVSSRSRTHRRETRGDHTAASSGSLSTSVEGEWLAGVAPTGHVYYYNTVSGKTTWEAPAGYGAIGVNPVPLSRCGALVTPIGQGGSATEDRVEILDGDDSTSGDSSSVASKDFRVVNYLVFEHVFGRKDNDWKLCGL